MKTRLPYALTFVILLFFFLVFLDRHQDGVNTNIDYRAFIRIDGVSYLSMELYDSLPSSCVLIGYTSSSNPEENFFSSMEPSGSSVFQDSMTPETVFVERQEKSFCKYTHALALHPTINYNGSLYVLLSNGLFVDGIIPDFSEFSPLDISLSFDTSNVFPRDNLKTNDIHLTNEKIYISENYPSFLYSSRLNNIEIFAELSTILRS